MTSRPGLLHLDGWAGRSAQSVLIVGETPARYRIMSTRRIRLGGRRRYLEPGLTALVPKRAITFTEPKASTS